MDSETPKMTTIDLWQRRLLPVMVIMVVVLAIFFFSASVHQLLLLNEKIENAPALTNSELVAKANPQQTFVEYQWNTLVLLESHTLQQRYHQANVLLMARTWVRYLGFVSGMVLAFIGAIFILGKLTDQPTNLSVDHKPGEVKPEAQSQGSAHNLSIQQSALKMTLATHSPGIILAVLGVMLMMVTIVVRQPIDVSDGPNYTNVQARSLANPLIDPPKPLVLDGSKAPENHVEPSDAEGMKLLLERAREKHLTNHRNGAQK